MKGQKAMRSEMTTILTGSLTMASCTIPIDADTHHPYAALCSSSASEGEEGEGERRGGKERGR